MDCILTNSNTTDATNGYITTGEINNLHRIIGTYLHLWTAKGISLYIYITICLLSYILCAVPNIGIVFNKPAITQIQFKYSLIAPLLIL